MTWKKRLTSRKFLLTLATAISGFAAALFDFDVDPQLVYGVAAVVATWVFSEARIDGTALALDGQRKDQIIQALQGKLQEFAQEIDTLRAE